MPGPGSHVRRLVNKADFECLLAARSLSRSAHFALHHVAGVPQTTQTPREKGGTQELSTGFVDEGQRPVDDLPGGCWIGCVIPKRLARRAVTRNLLRRQIRSAFGRHAGGLPAGLWLVRLRAPFAPAQFVSARSRALALAARSELDALLARVKP